MVIGLILFMLVMAAVGFASGRFDRTRGESYPNSVRRGNSLGMTFLMVAVMMAVIGVYKARLDNRTVRELAQRVAIYPGAEFEVRTKNMWLFETKDKPAAVVGFYEAVSQQHAARIIKKDDFKFSAMLPGGEMMEITIVEDARGTSIIYNKAVP